MFHQQLDAVDVLEGDTVSGFVCKWGIRIPSGRLWESLPVSSSKLTFYYQDLATAFSASTTEGAKKKVDDDTWTSVVYVTNKKNLPGMYWMEISRHKEQKMGCSSQIFSPRSKNKNVYVRLWLWLTPQQQPEFSTSTVCQLSNSRAVIRTFFCLLDVLTDRATCGRMSNGR